MAEVRSEIRFGGSNDELVWKSPVTDFNTGSTVVVHESQAAVFYLNGEASEELGAGIHVLETCQTPFIRKMIQKIQKTRTPFQAELYYINKVEMANLDWGVGDITYHEESFVFPIGARGIYSVRVENPRRLIEQINGTGWSYSRDELEERFFRLVASAVNNTLVQTMRTQNISILDAPVYRIQITEAVRPEVEELFARYGLKITQFVIEHIHVNEGEEGYRKLLELRETEGGGTKLEMLKAQREANLRAIAGQGEAAYRAAQGYTYQQEMQFDVLKTAAANEGDSTNDLGGGLMQMGVGLGMAGAVSGILKENLGKMAADVSSSVNVTAAAVAEVPSAPVCAKCGAALASGVKFCPECGERVIPAGKMICPNCGKLVSRGKFCSECGTPLAPAKKICPKCGTVIESGKFCPECGTPVSE